jgi:hypothetical protein
MGSRDLGACGFVKAVLMKLRLLFLLLAMAMLGRSALGQAGNCTQKDSSTRPDCPGALAFFVKLQSALRNNDRPSVASLVSYPALVRMHHRPARIRTRAELLAHFDQIFDAGVRCVILNASEKDVWGNWRGFTVDGGAVWFDGIIPRGKHADIKARDHWTRYPFKIITVNNESQYSCPKS